MFEPDPAFRALDERDGDPRLEDLGLIGDGTTAAHLRPLEGYDAGSSGP